MVAFNQECKIMGAAPDLLGLTSHAYQDYRNSRTIIDDFRDGTLYNQNPEAYKKLVATACNHFASKIQTIQMLLNGIITSCNELKTVDFDIIEHIQEGFFKLEDFAEHLNEDFADFKQAVDSSGCTLLPDGVRVRYNDVYQLIPTMPEKVERIRIDVLTVLHERLSPEQLRASIAG